MNIQGALCLTVENQILKKCEAIFNSGLWGQQKNKYASGEGSRWFVE